MGILQDRVAIVTGGGTGIGRGGATALAREGAAVAVCGPDEAALLETVRLVEAAGGRAMARVCDVAIAAEVSDLVEATVTAYGRLDIVYNNAGINGTGSLEEVDEALWDRVIAVNLKSCYLTARAALPHLRRAGGGVIINTSSVLGFNTFARQFTYAASKSGVIGLTKALAIDLADDNIRVLAIVPGSVDTPMMWGDASDARRAEWEALIEREHVARRVARPDEIGRVVAFLCSDGASFMTGSHVVIDGGTLAKWGGGI